MSGLSNLFAALAATPPLFVASIALLGLVVGSFLNVVIYRLPIILERRWRAECAGADAAASAHDESFNLVVPRSRCRHCGHPISALENVPVLSFLWLKGRCRACSKPIGWRYPLVEILTALLSALVAWRFGATLQTAFALPLVWALIAGAVIDFDHQILPDLITLPFLWLGLLVNSADLFTDLGSAVWGAAGGYLALWLVFHLFRLVTGKEGMGYGDFKLFALIGAWLGWQLLPLVILLASATGAVIGIAYLTLAKRGRDHPIPFGPFLCIAALLALFVGPDLIAWYLHGLRA